MEGVVPRTAETAVLDKRPIPRTSADQLGCSDSHAESRVRGCLDDDLHWRRLSPKSVAEGESFWQEKNQTSKGASTGERKSKRLMKCVVNLIAILVWVKILVRVPVLVFDTGIETIFLSHHAAAPTAIVHVGPRKTGSTSLQSALKNYSRFLGKDDYTYPFRRHYHLISCITKRVDRPVLRNNTSACPLCRNDTCNDGYYDESVLTFAKLREQKKNIIFSSESLDKIQKSKEFDALDKLFDGYDVRIVVVYRRYFEWLYSLFRESYRGGSRWRDWNFRGLYSRIDLRNVVTWLASMNKVLVYKKYSTSVYRRYRDRYGPERVSVVNFHERSGDVVENFLCHEALHATHACLAKRKGRIPPTILRASVPMEYDEIAVAAVDAGILDRDSISRPAAGEAIREWHEDVRNLTLGNFSRECPPKAILDEILKLSLDEEREFLPSFFNSSKGEAAALSFFEDRSKFMFCAVDTRAVLSDPKWRAFLAGLGQSHGREAEQQ